MFSFTRSPAIAQDFHATQRIHPTRHSAWHLDINWTTSGGARMAVWWRLPVSWPRPPPWDVTWARSVRSRCCQWAIMKTTIYESPSKRRSLTVIDTGNITWTNRHVYHANLCLYWMLTNIILSTYMFEDAITVWVEFRLSWHSVISCFDVFWKYLFYRNVRSMCIQDTMPLS